MDLQAALEKVNDKYGWSLVLKLKQVGLAITQKIL